MKGINAFSAMSGVDDRFVMASLLPADLPGGASATAKVRKQEKDTWFTRMTSSGWFAAAISLVVAFGVLAGIVAAGRMAPTTPGDGSNPSPGVPAGTNQNVLEGEHDESDESGESDESREDGSDIPFETSPVFDDPAEPQKGPVAIVSDGFTVSPKGYCVWASGQQLDGNGEMTGFDADGIGAVNQLGAIKDEIPKMSTSGNSFSLSLSDGMTLQNIRVFEIVEIQNDTFEELALGVEGADFSHDPIMYLSSLPANGDYIVVLEIRYENRSSADEYIMGVDEYAFWLITGSGWDDKAPVRVLIDAQTHCLQGFDGINSGHALTGMTLSIPTVVMTRESEWDVYLAPQGTLQSVTAYDGNFRLMMVEPDLEPLVSLPVWAEGDYYFVFTVSFPFEGVSLTLEYPIHIKLVDGETVQPPAPDTGSHPVIEDLVLNNGYMLWTEQWYDGGMVSGDGAGAEGQLSDLVAEGALEGYRLRHPADTPFWFRLGDHEPPLDRVVVYDTGLKRLGEAKNFTVLHELPAGEYIVILTVTMQGDYIPEADAFEATCYEYPFILEVYNP